MRRIIVSILLTLCLVFSLTGCAKCINTEYKTVEVEIVNEYNFDNSDPYTDYFDVNYFTNIGGNEIEVI